VLWTLGYINARKNKKFSDDISFQKRTKNDLIHKIYRALSYDVAKFLKIDHIKGSIAKGKHADLCIWDPERVSTLSDLPKNHLFVDKIIQGHVQKTFLRGKLIYDSEHADLSESVTCELVKPRK